MQRVDLAQDTNRGTAPETGSRPAPRAGHEPDLSRNRDRMAVVAAAEQLVHIHVDVLIDKPDGPVPEQEVRAPRVARLESDRVTPVTDREVAWGRGVASRSRGPGGYRPLRGERV